MTRDQFLTEKVLGECWHEWGSTFECKKCHKTVDYYNNINFSSSEGFFKLWNFCKEQEWWNNFVMSLGNYLGYEWISGYEKLWTLIDDKGTFANAIARYRGWEGE